MRTRTMIGNTEGGDFFVCRDTLYLAGDDAEINLRVYDGVSVKMMFDGRRVFVVTGHDLRFELSKVHDPEP